MRNVVLVCLDSVRADYFDDYADRLRSRADTNYRQCRAASGWSIPSHASMFTGDLPHVHGVHTHSRNFRTVGRDRTFVSTLPDHELIGVSANPYISTQYGFDSLFDEFIEVSYDREIRFDGAVSPNDLDLSDHGYVDYLKRVLKDRKPIRALANGVFWKFKPYTFLFSGRPWPELHDNGTKRILRKAKSSIEEFERPGRPVFAFANLMDAHLPMYHHIGLRRDLHSVPNIWTSKTGPSPREISHNTDTYGRYIRAYTELYRASIEYLDRLVDAWIGEIRRMTRHPTTIVITADHGENLGTKDDERHFDHHGSLSESVLHVPLLIINPPAGSPETEQKMVSHLQLGDLVTSLVRGETFEISDEPVVAETIGHTGEKRGGAYWDRSIRCVYEGRRKVVWDSLGGVYEYRLDPEMSCKQELTATSIQEFPDPDETLFDADILEVKREAVHRELQEREHNITGRIRDRLDHLGYT